ncbi:unnamed protein product [Schistosoma rodhaini]|uniref:MEG-5 n=1 Tax=Schistosoma mansoni TaxID=6183 RepID=G4LYD1_SCHMA|nr:MEG-5 [Schistosoma mansoni]CAH8607711.1 unnamed protein product [Schistosoma rodhaini]|eukprot:XP_018646268.1 MEG-5 [Schistosoma mansoni]
MRRNYLLLYICIIVFILLKEINASGRQPKFVNVDTDGNLRSGGSSDISDMFGQNKTLGTAFKTLLHNLWDLLKQSLGLP